MKAEDIARAVDSHGGVKRVVVVPQGRRNGGKTLANKLICADGWAYTTTIKEDLDLIAFYKAAEARMAEAQPAKGET